MMNNMPKVQLFGQVDAAKLASGFNMPASRLEGVEQTGQDFKSVFTNLVKDVNTQMAQPDALMADLMNGNPNVDIHDVMTAMAKSELGITVAANVTTKVIQAYEKIMQIQI